MSLEVNRAPEAESKEVQAPTNQTCEECEEFIRLRFFFQQVQDFIKSKGKDISEHELVKMYHEHNHQVWR